MNKILRRLKSLSLLGFTCSILLTSTCGFCGDENREEFPNYFSELPVGQAREKIEKALDTTLRRLQVPYLDESGAIRSDGFFLKLSEKLHEKDTEAQPYVSGGVVRSLLGYIYKEIYSAKQKDPDANVGDILDKIGQREKDIPAIKALGIGSDLDILIDSPGHPNETGVVQREAEKFINSVSLSLNINGEKNVLANSLLPPGDVLNYESQMKETISQGGSTLDWLAFPLPTSHSPHAIGALREPKEHSGIVDRFIQGTYDYLPPPQGVRAKDKQTIRGLRPLLEIPFLSLTPPGERQMAKELTEIRDDAAKGILLSEGAITQFKKMIRNARFSSGQNRFHISDKEFEKTALEISKQYSLNNKKLPLIPEFLESRPALKRKIKELPPGIPLVPVEEFISKYTENGSGKLYHGTPQVENLLTMIRNGMVVSNQRQGTAAFGHGFYTTNAFSTAQDYASLDGVVIEFPIRTELKPRILNLGDPNVSDSEGYRQILREFNEIIKDNSVRSNGAQPPLNLDINEYLAKNYGIDIVINRHLLVQNASILKVPKKLEQLISSAGMDARSAVSQKYGKNMASKLMNYLSYAELAKALNIPLTVSAEALVLELVQGLRDPNPEIQSSAAMALGKINSKDPKVHLALTGALKDSDSAVRLYAASALTGGWSKHSQIRLALFEAALKDSDSNVRSQAVEALSGCNDPEIQNILIEALKDSDSNVRFCALTVLKNMQPKDPKIHLAIVAALKDPDSNVRNQAINALEMLNPPDPKDPKIHLAIAERLKDSDLNIQLAAFKYLKKLGPADPNIHLALAEALKDPSWEVRSQAANILGGARTRDTKIHLALADRLKDLNPIVRNAAAYALRRIQPQEIEVHLALAEGLKDSDSKVRSLFASTLGELKPTDARIHLALVDALYDQEYDVRSDAARALSSMQPTDLKFYHALVQGLKDPNPEVRIHFASALGVIKSSHPTIRQAIVEGLKEPDPNVRIHFTLLIVLLKLTDDPNTYLTLLGANKNGSTNSELNLIEKKPETRKKLIQNLILESSHADELKKKSIISALSRLHGLEAPKLNLKNNALSLKEKLQAYSQAGSCERTEQVPVLSKGLEVLIHFLNQRIIWDSLGID